MLKLFLFIDGLVLLSGVMTSKNNTEHMLKLQIKKLKAERDGEELKDEDFLLPEKIGAWGAFCMILKYTINVILVIIGVIFIIFVIGSLRQL